MTVEDLADGLEDSWNHLPVTTREGGFFSLLVLVPSLGVPDFQVASNTDECEIAPQPRVFAKSRVDVYATLAVWNLV